MTKLTYNQLIAKLKQAEANAPKNLDYFLNPEENFELSMLEMQMMDMSFDLPPSLVKSFGEMPMSERLEIKTEEFPAQEELEEDEIQTIVSMILNVWDKYHFVAGFPDGLPCRIAYKALLSVWDDPVMCIATGHFHFDFYELELDQYVKSDPSKALDLPF